MSESVVYLTRFLATPGFGVGVDYVGDVGVFVDGQVNEFQPVAGRYQVERVIGQVAHEQKLAGEELGVHLIGLNGQQRAETADRFSVETVAGIGPGEGMGEELIPCGNEGPDGLAKLLDRAEVIVHEALAFEDAEPYLNEVQPGGMERYKVHDNAFVL